MDKRWLPWPATPIKGFDLSPAGFLALADISTIAQRTLITGTSTWWDILLLAPGLHNQQSAEHLHEDRPPATAHSPSTGRHFPIRNAATVRYLHRVARQAVSLDVGRKIKQTRSIRSHGVRSEIEGDGDDRWDRDDIIATLLYGLCPTLTITSIILLLLTRDWWALTIVLLLMLSRALNIWIIRQRVQDRNSGPAEQLKYLQRKREELWVWLDPDRCIKIRGLNEDLDALTKEWLRQKTAVEGYLEAMAKLIVYLTAALTSNMHQTGEFIVAGLLIISAGLLGLSNQWKSKFEHKGRTVDIGKHQENSETDLQVSFSRTTTEETVDIGNGRGGKGGIDPRDQKPSRNGVTIRPGQDEENCVSRSDSAASTQSGRERWKKGGPYSNVPMMGVGWGGISGHSTVPIVRASPRPSGLHYSSSMVTEGSRFDSTEFEQRLESISIDSSFPVSSHTDYV